MAETKLFREIRRQMIAYSVNAECHECPTGEMVSTGQCRLKWIGGREEEFHHICKTCNAERWLPKKYPFIVHEEEEVEIAGRFI